MSTATVSRAGSARTAVQKFGTFLSNMVMPNIGAFIAWGFITSLFIQAGWLNQAHAEIINGEVQMVGGLFAPDSWVANIGGWGKHMVDGKEVAFTGIVGPMITYLLPILIGYTGGRNVYAERQLRGGVVGAIATFGVIAGTSIPMFMGAMIMGPLGGWTIKWIDSIWDGKIRPGFEMLVDNFSAGIWGLILAVLGFFGLAPIVTGVSAAAGGAVNWLVSTKLLPLTSLFIEPAKVLFLNNAINHGVLTPLGLQQSKEIGQSVLFLLEANPGPGLGLLLAYMFFGKGTAKASASGAAIIHFIGGIHEIYFPYVLMKPIMILSTIAGGMTGVLMNVLFNGGLRSPAAPGSIIAVYASSTPQGILGVTISWIAAAAVAFLVGSFLLRISKDDDEGDLSKATADMEAMKGKKSSVSGALTGAGAVATVAGPIHNIVFACDAGMGSSAMGASVLRKKIQAAGFNDVKVVNQAIANLTDTYDVIVTHQDLADRAGQKTPSAAMFTVDNFMASPVYDDVVDLVRRSNSADAPTADAAAPVADVAPAAAPVAAAAAPVTAAGAAVPVAAAVASSAPAVDDSDSVLKLKSIVLDGQATTRDEAITEAGELLVASGNVDSGYVASMHDRERSVSTYMGNLLAIPHGTNEAKSMITKSAISVVRYPNGIDWNGNPVKFVIGIAGAGNDHLDLLGKIAEVFLDEDKIAGLEAATSAQEIADAFGKVNG